MHETRDLGSAATRSPCPFAATWLMLLVATQSAAAPPAEPNGGDLTRHEFERVEMAVPFRIILYAADADVANQAATAAFDRIAALNKLLSDYDAESELRRLCRDSSPGEPIRVSDELWTVLVRGQQIAEQSGGAFDVTVGPLIRLWRRARREHQLPKPEQIAEARELVGYQSVKLHHATHSVELMKRDMRLDLGGIAKGYASDEALAILRQRGFSRALVAGAGDIALGDPPPGENGWRVGIEALDPNDRKGRRYLLVSNAGVSTSGDLFQYVEIDGKRYSHIVDPYTGLGLTVRSSVTVVAADDMTADALATAVTVMGPEKGLALIEQTPGAAALVVRIEGDEQREYASSRLPQFEIQPDAASTSSR